ncbi:MAG: response regulator [Myxococcales bacterium]|nr:response regulator [Myxococcales bacterium]
MSATILVVEPNPATRALVRRTLTDLGHVVHEAADGAAALAALADAAPDLILQDLELPDLDGMTLVGELRRRLGDDIRILAFSGLGARPGELPLIAAGFDDVIAKPIEASHLTAIVTSHLGTPELDANDVHARAVRATRTFDQQIDAVARLERRTVTLTAQLTVVARVSEALLSQHEIGPALDDALAACFDAGGISVGALYLLEADGRLSARSLGTLPGVEPAALATFFDDGARLRALIAGREPTALTACDAPPSLARVLRDHPDAAVVVTPVRYRDQVLGGLFMVSRGRVPDSDWVIFARAVANQIAVAVTLARMFEGQERASREIAASRASLLALTEHAPDTIAQLDCDGIIQFINRTTPGRDRAEVIGSHWLRWLPPGAHARLTAALQDVVATGRGTSIEAESHGSDGTVRWWAAHLGPIVHDGKITGVVSVSHDITARKAHEAQLMVTDRMASLGSLAGGVAHEINNPLAVVMSNLDLIGRAGGITDPELQDAIHDATDAATRVRQIIRDLMIFSGAGAPRHGAVDVRAVVDATIRLAWNEIRHRARLIRHLDEVPRVDGDEAQLGQVFLNLLVNAAHAIPEGHAADNHITVVTRRDGPLVAIDVIDSGVGMSDDVARRVFTPFFSTKQVGVGTGLGLAICHGIITALGGEIHMTTAPGRGSTFTVLLPPVATVPAPEVAPAPATPPRRARVLVVDDEPLIGKSIRRMLSAEHDVTVVDRAAEALARFDRGDRWDVILCDLMMPHMTGMDLHAEVARRSTPDAERMVFLTGGAFTPRAREFLDTVSNARLDKPFDADALKALIASRLS